MISSNLKNKRPPFFARLSNLIFLQLFFIFASFGMLFLFPLEEKISTTDPKELEENFKFIAEQILECNISENQQSCNELLEKICRTQFSDLDYIGSKIYICYDNEEIQPLFNDDKENKFQAGDFDRDLIISELDKSENHLVQTIPSTQYLVYYYTFDLTPDQKALIAIKFAHQYFVTSKNKVIYIFGMLFLGGILISSLTVYLINKRIREPLARIMKGLEKTTEGEIYYMVETNKDIELNQLTASFNKMSKTLWDNAQTLKKNNLKLTESNNNLNDSKEFLRKILDNSTSSIITTNQEGIIEIFNETAAEHFELSIEAAKGSHVSKLFTDDFDINSLEYKSHKEIEVTCKRSDGTVFSAFVLVAPIYDSENEISSLLYVMQDITESKSIHNMMVRMDRYYTKGEMAGDIAHEINNFLAILSGNIELMPLLLKKNDPEKIQKKLELMKKQVDRIVNFTDGLLEANDGDDSFVQVDINQLIKVVVLFLQPQNLFDYIKIESKLAKNIPLVHTQIGNIRQLLVNLVYNAGEEIYELEGDKEIEISSELSGDVNNKTVTLTVKDNGAGVADENIDYLFHKRFTTKVHGHGISLVACQKIVETHSGSIEYSYENGAIFTIVLPISQTVDKENSFLPSDSNSVYT